MKKFSIRFSRRIPIPPTVQILDELRAATTPGYVPKTRRAGEAARISAANLPDQIRP